MKLILSPIEVTQLGEHYVAIVDEICKSFPDIKKDDLLKPFTQITPTTDGSFELGIDPSWLFAFGETGLLLVSRFAPVLAAFKAAAMPEGGTHLEHAINAIWKDVDSTPTINGVKQMDTYETDLVSWLPHPVSNDPDAPLVISANLRVETTRRGIVKGLRPHRGLYSVNFSPKTTYLSDVNEGWVVLEYNSNELADKNLEAFNDLLDWEGSFTITVEHKDITRRFGVTKASIDSAAPDEVILSLQFLE